MTTMDVDFCDDDNLRFLHLFSHAGEPGSHQTLHLERRITSQVYVGTMVSQNSRPKQVVFKFGRGVSGAARRERELGFYCVELRQLQGKVIPELLGVFRGSYGGEPITAMLLEYCIANAPTSDEDYGHEVMLGCMRIHELGVIHGNIEPRHVVRTRTGIRFISFSRSTTHLCARICPGFMHPRPGSLSSCVELNEVFELFGHHLYRSVSPTSIASSSPSSANSSDPEFRYHPEFTRSEWSLYKLLVE